MYRLVHEPRGDFLLSFFLSYRLGIPRAAFLREKEHGKGLRAWEPAFPVFLGTGLGIPRDTFRQPYTKLVQLPYIQPNSRTAVSPFFSPYSFVAVLLLSSPALSFGQKLPYPQTKKVRRFELRAVETDFPTCIQEATPAALVLGNSLGRWILTDLHRLLGFPRAHQ